MLLDSPWLRLRAELMVILSSSSIEGATTTPWRKRNSVAIALSMSLPPMRREPEDTMPPKEINADSDAPAPKTVTADPTGSCTGRPRPIAAAMGASIRLTSRAPA